MGILRQSHYRLSRDADSVPNGAPFDSARINLRNFASHGSRAPFYGVPAGGIPVGISRLSSVVLDLESLVIGAIFPGTGPIFQFFGLLLISLLNDPLKMGSAVASLSAESGMAFFPESTSSDQPHWRRQMNSFVLSLIMTAQSMKLCRSVAVRALYLTQPRVLPLPLITAESLSAFTGCPQSSTMGSFSGASPFLEPSETRTQIWAPFPRKIPGLSVDSVLPDPQPPGLARSLSKSRGLFAAAGTL